MHLHVSQIAFLLLHGISRGRSEAPRGRGAYGRRYARRRCARRGLLLLPLLEHSLCPCRLCGALIVVGHVESALKDDQR
ncbi:hypothetical protein B0H17DRAFT_1070234 [Mycena rosella]|uniref:Secreted protein n=1 Tax=Mycena rosella TaxID=1033263 RepID=A0AAD7DBK3_MYCRO|nr:hypothetical protein B0H17DRAFT_1070234 [Mycena rosella]